MLAQAIRRPKRVTTVRMAYRFLSVGPGKNSRTNCLLPRSWPDENVGPWPPRITTRTVSSRTAVVVPAATERG